MRKHYDPEVVAEWTQADLEKLIGKYVSVEVEASAWYRENVPDGGDWEGGSGLCEDAGRKSAVDKNNNTIDINFIHWNYGMGWAWRPDQIAHVYVCDEHGEHDLNDKKSAKCLRTLGVCGETKGGNIGEAGTSREEA